MDKKEFLSFINSVLKPFHFKKNGMKWRLDLGEIVEQITIQKSVYGNLYYFHYGYFIKSISTQTGYWHVPIVWTNSELHYKSLGNLLDMENNIDEETRLTEIREIVMRILTNHSNKIKTEIELKNFLLSTNVVNAVPLTVKRYLRVE